MPSPFSLYMRRVRNVTGDTNRDNKESRNQFFPEFDPSPMGVSPRVVPVSEPNEYEDQA